MDGIHDLGGRQGFGRVRHTLDAHRPSTSRGRSASTRSTRSRSSSASSTWTSTATRSSAWSRATISSASYYERSLTSLATLCVEKGIVTREELERRAQGDFPLAAPSAPGRTQRRRTRERFKPATGSASAPSTFPATCACRATSAARPASSSASRRPTRSPTRMRTASQAEDEPTYDVRFNAEELWPNSADPAHVHVGVFQSYLERAKSDAQRQSLFSA